MRLSNKIDKLNADWIPGLKAGRKKGSPNGSGPLVTRVYLYEGSDRIREYEFSQQCVSIGSSNKADLMITGTEIADTHAYVYVENEQLFIFGLPAGAGLIVNEQSAKAAILGPKDSVSIGAYTLKFKLEPQIEQSPGDDPVPVKKKKPAPAKKKNGYNGNGNGKGGLKLDLKSVFQDLLPGKESAADEALTLQSDGKNKSEPELLDSIPDSSGDYGPENQDDIPFQVVFKGQFKDGREPVKVVRQLKRRYKLQEDQTAVLLSGKPITIKRGLNLSAATKFKKTFEKTGALCELEAILDGDQPEEEPQNGNGKHHPEFKGLPLEVPKKKRAATKPKKSAPKPVAVDEEDEDDDDIEASFSLKEKLCMFTGFDRQVHRKMPGANKDLGIFKFRKDSVVDVKYLNGKSNFFIRMDRKRFRLAHKTKKGQNFFYFDDRFSGIIRDKHSGVVPLSDLQVKENLYRRRKGLYRISVPETGEVVVSDGCYDYLIRGIAPSQSPHVPETAKSKKIDWKYLGYSLGVHVVMLVFFTVMTLLPSKPPPEPETRFVTVDQQQLAQIRQKPKPVVKPKPKKVVAAKPVKKKPVVKKKAVKKTPKPRKRTVQKTTKARRKGRARAPSRHPKAGGGAGKGNVRNRNIKQVGILSMLGDSSGAKSKPAIASITNLDAVKSNSAGKANFKVGGIKGKLGNSKVSVPTTDVVTTRGNSQVLRSAGIGGKGRVAALAKGSVGQKKVVGMVRARLNKSVKINGGMSREAVKRVIEQHLDEVTYCYESALISNPSIKGRIIYEWKIRMSGRVGEVRIKSSTVNSNDIHACIKSAIKTWQFPKPVGSEVVVSYPFIFDIVGF